VGPRRAAVAVRGRPVHRNRTEGPRPESLSAWVPARLSSTLGHVKCAAPPGTRATRVKIPTVEDEG